MDAMRRCDGLPPHGGDIEAFERCYGCRPLDFSVNTNPYGLSPAARKAAIGALDHADRYPDPHCRGLVAALARRNGVDSSGVLVGNGATDVTFRLMRALSPARALVCAPTFSEYEWACARVGCSVEAYALDPSRDYLLDEGILERLDGVDVVFLCEPNNPTGQLDDPSLLRRVLSRCEESGCVLVVDECFNGFLAKPEEASIRGLVPDHPRLVVIDALTKTHGMAGLRLGYALCSDADLVARAWAAGVPWSVSVIAQEAGCAALGDEEHVERARELVARERPIMAEELASMGLEVIPSQANYLTARAPVSDLPARLARRGVMVRDCGTYDGLPDDCVRFAVRLPEENRRLVEAVREALADEGRGEAR